MPWTEPLQYMYKGGSPFKMDQYTLVQLCPKFGAFIAV